VTAHKYLLMDDSECLRSEADRNYVDSTPGNDGKEGNRWHG
jgi:hypothetical protein